MASGEENEIEWTRVNLRWKGKQPKLPTVQIQKLSLELKLGFSNFLEKDLITELLLELLIDLVTQF